MRAVMMLAGGEARKGAPRPLRRPALSAACQSPRCTARGIGRAAATSDYLSRLSEVPFRHASLRCGYGFFPSPNNLRIFAIRLAMGQLYDHPDRLANGFAKLFRAGGGGDHLSQYPLQSEMAEGSRLQAGRAEGRAAPDGSRAGGGSSPAGHAAADPHRRERRPGRARARPRRGPDRRAGGLSRSSRRREGVAGEMAARMLLATWRAGGPAGCVRKVSAAIRMALPVLVRGRRTAASVAAYFDLITDEGRLFYGDSFHFGYFRSGSETLAEALDAHTDLVAEMARLQRWQRVLDVGCGIGAPALRIAERYGCEIAAVNISREQVRQGRSLIEERRMSHRVEIARGDARALDFPDASFDAIVCLEA